MISCPCCSNQMLRHIREHQMHFFCRHCWAEMPDLDIQADTLRQKKLVGKDLSHEGSNYTKEQFCLA